MYLVLCTSLISNYAFKQTASMLTTVKLDLNPERQRELQASFLQIADSSIALKTKNIEFQSWMELPSHWKN